MRTTGVGMGNERLNQINIYQEKQRHIQGSEKQSGKDQYLKMQSDTHDSVWTWTIKQWILHFYKMGIKSTTVDCDF